MEIPFFFFVIFMRTFLFRTNFISVSNPASESMNESNIRARKVSPGKSFFNAERQNIVFIPTYLGSTSALFCSNDFTNPSVRTSIASLSSATVSLSLNIPGMNRSFHAFIVGTMVFLICPRMKWGGVEFGKNGMLWLRAYSTMSSLATPSNGRKNLIPSCSTTVSIPDRFSYFVSIATFWNMFSKTSSLL
ncbi:hypothetical protein ATCV1_z729R [Acanthocystis turfacea chlorella virus 1]|uniref:Uncharacterized protein z729R n=1 Tax=Chlorovirus heliozoae TaxID=322019 RepID=A7K9Y9_9PHYC|nr:hypothetical protein ATCV1_z729R [Acanthocystis turfacea chlorella virus 1]ABT16863.1 hypothetical protein ATCV1_z729R [Acanthocystis turfacea chlorella virus 1]